MCAVIHHAAVGSGDGEGLDVRNQQVQCLGAAIGNSELVGCQTVIIQRVLRQHPGNRKLRPGTVARIHAERNGADIIVLDIAVDVIGGDGHLLHGAGRAAAVMGNPEIGQWRRSGRECGNGVGPLIHRAGKGFGNRDGAGTDRVAVAGSECPVVIRHTQADELVAQRIGVEYTVVLVDGGGTDDDGVSGRGCQ